MKPEVHHGDGLELLKTRKWDHILTDPDYERQPDASLYREHCPGSVILFCDPTRRPPGPAPDEVLVWLKPPAYKNVSKRCAKMFEEILVYRGGESVFNCLHWSSMTGIFTDGFVTKVDHPYAKPPTLIEKLVLMYTDPGDLVYDPFCGSGTVGAACLKHGRKYVGCEIERKYYDMACKAVQ